MFNPVATVIELKTHPRLPKPPLSSELRTLYPELQAPTSSLLVEAGWQIAYAEAGNPNGIPVVFVHGGPGEQYDDSDLQFFDPSKYRIIAFDQRGTGRSSPSALNQDIPSSHFSTISINMLVEDMEKLRKHLNIDRWLVFGGSWGSTLSLYYAQEYPKQTSGIVLRGIFLATAEENNRFFDNATLEKELGEKWDPTSLQALYDYARSKLTGTAITTPKQLIEAYYQLAVEKDDFCAMHLWTSFEDYVDSPSPQALKTLLDLPKSAKDLDPRCRSVAIFESLFFSTLPKTLNLLDPARIQSIAKLPSFIVQGQQDSECPKKYAEKLVEALKDAHGNVTYYPIEEGKHSPYNPHMTDALVRITDEFTI